MKSFSSEARAALAAQIAKVTGNPVDPNRVKVTEGLYYTRKTIGTGNAIVDLIEDSDTLSVGTTNLNNAKTAKGKHLLVTEMRLATVANASVIGDKYTNLLADEGVYTGDLTIMQNGKELFNGPAANFHREAATAGYEFVEVTPFLIEADVPIDIKFQSKVASAANTNIELIFKGPQTAAR